MIDVELVGVRVEIPGNTPVVLLRALDGSRRQLPILIGDTEARAIVFALDGVPTPRPLTHDLLVDAIAELGATIESIEITDLRDRTFFADLRLLRGDEHLVISSRPSDAVAIAVRVGCPIRVADSVMDAAGFVEEPEERPSDEMLEQFKEFIETLTPEDFND
ncbi:MAG: bifunctional nuclease family protein [Actinobacteria bacterium]|nr:bifunctional nuclease family protein [Actinomycetota bacterium]